MKPHDPKTLLDPLVTGGWGGHTPRPRPLSTLRTSAWLRRVWLAATLILLWSPPSTAFAGDQIEPLLVGHWRGTLHEAEANFDLYFETGIGGNLACVMRQSTTSGIPISENTNYGLLSPTFIGVGRDGCALVFSFGDGEGVTTMAFTLKLAGDRLAGEVMAISGKEELQKAQIVFVRVKD